jgi:hypothetical protein
MVRISSLIAAASPASRPTNHSLFAPASASLRKGAAEPRVRLPLFDPWSDRSTFVPTTPSLVHPIAVPGCGTREVEGSE